MTLSVNIQTKSVASEMDTLVPRIIQYQGQRFCIRLEDSYWTVLEDEAKGRHCKLNELVHKYYSDPLAQKNKTAFLRLKAIEWLSSKVAEADDRLNMKNTELRAVLRATIQPAIIFSSEQSVSRYNKAFRDWLGANTIPPTTDPVIENLRVSFRRSYRCLMDLLEEGRGSTDNEQVTILIPGYVFPVRMNIVKLNRDDDDEQIFMGIIIQS